MGWNPNISQSAEEPSGVRPNLPHFSQPVLVKKSTDVVWNIHFSYMQMIHYCLVLIQMKMKYNLRGTPEKFDSVWGCMISYTAKLKTLQDKWNAQVKSHHISFPSLPHSNPLTKLLLCMLAFSVNLFICFSANGKKEGCVLFLTCSDQ